MQASQVSVRKVALFLREGSQGSEEIGDLLRVTKGESHKSEADPEGISHAWPTQTRYPEPCQPGGPLRGSDRQQPQLLVSQPWWGVNYPG